jgi:hypothetical protein
MRSAVVRTVVVSTVPRIGLLSGEVVAVFLTANHEIRAGTVHALLRVNARLSPRGLALTPFERFWLVDPADDRCIEAGE